MSASFEHKKSLGQHFLNSDIVPNWLCTAATITPGETVLEIGPGTGALTRTLLAAGARVVALEADQRAIAVLQETFASHIAEGTLCMYHTDVRQLDLTQFGLTDHTYKVVANIPYYLSGHLFRTLLENSIQPTDLVFLVQKEVAKRITVAKERDEKESLLSVACKLYGTVQYVRSVPRGHFTPPPKVDSAIIAIHDISRNAFGDVPEKIFFQVLHIGFGQKRKQLLGNLAPYIPRETLTSIFDTYDIPRTIRAEDITIETWQKLIPALVPHFTDRVTL